MSDEITHPDKFKTPLLGDTVRIPQNGRSKFIQDVAWYHVLLEMIVN